MTDIDKETKYTSKVSVILPVYNVEEYIGRCIESLQAQTMSELEFIFVDDCSTDGSMTAVEAWAAQDERVRILRNEKNLGAGSSRNRGIEAARGDYLNFIDPDDYVTADYYEQLYAAAIAGGGHDIAKGYRQKVQENGELLSDQDNTNERMSRQLKEGWPLHLSFMNEHQTGLFKRSLFENTMARYGVSSNAEDTIFLMRTCWQTEDIVFEPAAIYYYVQRDGSASASLHIERFLNEADSLDEKIAFLSSHDTTNRTWEFLEDKTLTLLRRFQAAAVKNPSLYDDYGQLVGRVKKSIQTFPFKQRAVLWFKVLRRLASRQDLNAALHNLRKMRRWMQNDQ